jgi:hypothetical protein
MAALLVFVQRTLLHPLALHAYMNPVQLPVDISVPRKQGNYCTLE